MTYANIAPWAYVRMSALQPSFSGAPGLVWSPLFWFPVTTRYEAPELLIPVFGLGSSIIRDIELLWRAGLPAGVMLALVMAFWRRSRLATLAYMVWLIIVTAGVVAFAYEIFGRPPQAQCVMACDQVRYFALQPGPGVWWALVALALLWIAAGARLAVVRGASTGARLWTLTGAIDSLRNPAQMGALVFSAGALVWVFGYIFTPWATQGCTGFPVNWTHFVIGSCAGLDANDALGAAWMAGSLSAGEYVSLYVITGLLLLAALIGVWQRGWIPAIVVAFWTALATWLMKLALGGLPALLTNPPRLSYSTAPWSAGAGPTVTEIGVALAWVGVIWLWWRLLTGWRDSQARAQRESARA
ncbi:MAG TPA: hypothetical protein VF808_11560 [Ktedonobacterales bacterium]